MSVQVVVQTLPYLLRGTLSTVAIAAAVIVVGTAGGVALGLLRFAPWRGVGAVVASLAAIIGVFELTRAAQETIERTFRSFEIYLTAAAIYFVICFPLTRFAQRAEARLLRP